MSYAQIQMIHVIIEKKNDRKWPFLPFSGYLHPFFGVKEGQIGNETVYG